MSLVLARPHKKHTNTKTKEAFTKERDESALSNWYSGSQNNGRQPSESTFHGESNGILNIRVRLPYHQEKLH